MINQMKKHLLTLTALSLFAVTAFGQAKTDTAKRYSFSEPDIILVDNLMGQLDLISGNSDKVNTAQYKYLHSAVLRIDSLIKIQYLKHHPQKEQPIKK